MNQTIEQRAAELGLRRGERETNEQPWRRVELALSNLQRIHARWVANR